MGRPGRPGANLREGALGHAGGVIVHAKDKRRDGIDVALGQAFQHGGVFAGLVESFVHVFEIGGIDRLHADEDPLAAGGGDEVDQFFVAQQVGADLRHPVDLGAGGDDVAQQRLGALHVDGEIVVDEEDRHLALLFAGARPSAAAVR